MEIDFGKLVENFDISELTLRKTTNKFVREHFDIETIVNSQVFGDGNVKNNEKNGVLKSEKFIPEIIEVKRIPLQKIFMGQEMPTSLYLGFLQSRFDREFIKTIQTRQGVFLEMYNKTKPMKVSTEASPILTKDEVISEIRNFLKEKIRNK